MHRSFLIRHTIEYNFFISLVMLSQAPLLSLRADAFQKINLCKIIHDRSTILLYCCRSL